MNSHMEAGRQFPKGFYRGIKSLVRSVCHDVFGSFRLASESTCATSSLLEKYANPADPNMIRFDIAVDLDHAAGEPNFIAYAADALGYDLVKRDSNHVCVDFAELNSQTVKELSGVLITLADALEDGKISPNEAKDILAKNHGAKAILRALECACLNVAAGCGE